MKIEIKVLLFLILLAVFAELGVRRFGNSLSKDVEHLNSLDQLRSDLQPEGPANILILGNSLSRQAFDRPLMEKTMQLSEGTTITTAALHPDASSVLDWSQAFRRYVLLPGCRPKWVLIGTGKGHLLDPTNDMVIDRLGAWLVPPKERWAFAKAEGLGIEKIVPFFWSANSQLFSNRTRIQPLVFYNLVPGYEETSRMLNEGHGSPITADSSMVEEVHQMSVPQPTTRHLQRLLDDVRVTGATPIVITLPLPQRYHLPTQVNETLVRQGVQIIDFGSAHTLSEAFFPDGYHLNAEGGSAFTLQLINYLSKGG